MLSTTREHEPRLDRNSEDTIIWNIATDSAGVEIHPILALGRNAINNPCLLLFAQVACGKRRANRGTSWGRSTRDERSFRRQEYKRNAVFFSKNFYVNKFYTLMISWQRVQTKCNKKYIHRRKCNWRICKIEGVKFYKPWKLKISRPIKVLNRS